MPRTHKPSTWQAPAWKFNQEIYDEVVACYPPDLMQRIVASAHLDRIQPDAGKRAELARIVEHNIILLGVWTKNWLNLPKRPTPPQRKAALAKIRNAAKNLHEVLATLDSDAAEDFRRVMLADDFSRHALGIDPAIDMPGPMQGFAKYQTLVNLSQKIEQWASTARAGITARKEGNRSADVKRWYAEGLVDIWIQIGYKRPTITCDPIGGKAKGPLMEFATAAARPLRLFSMESAIRHAIAEWKKKGRTPPQ
jgi:hypothetical protein